MMMAPIHIKFMIACYTTSEPMEQLGERHWNSTAGLAIREWLFENELIDTHNRATEKGVAWVKFICSTPLPVSKWMLPPRSDDVSVVQKYHV